MSVNDDARSALARETGEWKAAAALATRLLTDRGMLVGRATDLILAHIESALAQQAERIRDSIIAEEQEKWGQIRKAIDDALAVGKEERVSDKHGPFPNCPTCAFPIDAGGFCGLNCPDPKPAVTMPCTCTECRAKRDRRKP